VSGSSTAVRTKFKNQEFKTLVVVDRLREGFDHPNISVVAFVRGVTSLVLFEQSVGRALRKVDGGDTTVAMIIAHVSFQVIGTLTLDEADEENEVE
jgi:superfamily II DNA or RNA helicase